MYENIISLLKDSGCAVTENAPMSRYTTFKTGGCADILCECRNRKSAKSAYRFLYESGMPFTVLGRCSNVLVSDKGYRGVILRFFGDNYVEETGDFVLLSSGGASSVYAAEQAAKRGLGGMEFAGTVPGSMGGLCRMNAGCFGMEMKDIVHGVSGVADGKEFSLKGEECGFSYRDSVFCKKNCIILEVSLKLRHVPQSGIKNEMKRLFELRKSSQPLNIPSAGSVFKRKGGIIPAKLIDEAGLKGTRDGGAVISRLHGGFIVNAGGAASQDIYRLINYIKEKIYSLYSVDLEEEILYIGEF